MLLIPLSVSFVSLNYACIVGWNYCNIYGWMPLCWTCYVWWNYACNIYGWMMKLCVGYLICLLCNGLLKYIYICHIYLWWKLLDLIKNRANMQALCRLPPTATGSLPSAADGKEATWHPVVLLGSWPIWSVCLQWQTAKTLPSVADGKEPALCHQWQTAKNLPSSDVYMTS